MNKGRQFPRTNTILQNENAALRNKFSVFEDEDIPIIITTAKPLRKLKKKLRKANQNYKNNPSPELSNIINKLQEDIRILETPPVKEKKKKLKKKKIDKAEEYKKRKEKKAAKLKKKFYDDFQKFYDDLQKVREENRRKEEEKQRREYEKKRRREYEEWRNRIIVEFGNEFFEDIQQYKKNPLNNREYHTLSRKYHPDKGGNNEHMAKINEIRDG